ncbi:MAG: acylglycerol kinase family protein, partial [Clostridia bacterium]|nr:acylglycerol kinase family protein [Clostridia bacterium]
MRKIMILNPAAGHGDADKLTSPDEKILIYKTKSVGDAERYVTQECRIDPETHFIVCGGDGTVNEVVNGIISAGAGESAMFSIVPTGTGNDFIKNDLEKKKVHKVDVVAINGRYAVNMINIGFDC